METSPTWTASLKRALESWQKSNGYIEDQLIQELDIEAKHWKSLMKQSVCKNKAVYAKLFVWTGLTEADPRTIPSRRMYQPNSGDFRDIERAMSESEYQIWLNSDESLRIQQLLLRSQPRVPARPNRPTVRGQPNPKKPKRAMPATPEQTSVASSAPPIEPSLTTSHDLGSAIEVLIEAIAERTAAKVFKQPKSQSAMTVDRADLEMLVAEVIARLQPAIHGSEEERDLISEHYRDILTELVEVADPFTRNKDRREAQIRHHREVGI